MIALGVILFELYFGAEVIKSQSFRQDPSVQVALSLISSDLHRNSREILVLSLVHRNEPIDE